VRDLPALALVAIEVLVTPRTRAEAAQLLDDLVMIHKHRLLATRRPEDTAEISAVSDPFLASRGRALMGRRRR
jgi:hypothetical protein